jgi:SHS2 domain-containing protein
MRQYKFLEHTADVLLEATGDTPKEALEAAALALFNTIADTEKVHAARELQVHEEAESLGELAVFTLSRLLSEMEAEELFFKDFKVARLQEKGGKLALDGTATGGPQDPTLGRTVVKAVTHHLLQTSEEAGKWRIRILLDV